MDERVCPKCNRTGTIIMGVRSRGAGMLERRLDCRVCKYSWIDEAHDATPDLLVVLTPRSVDGKS